MVRAEKFKEVFGIYAEEFWTKSEQEMLDWIGEEMEPISKVILQGNYIFNGFITAGGTCENCSNVVICGDKYCSICGRKLDWTN